jgi:PQQ-like domain
VADGVVFVGSLDHRIYALNASNGTLIWSYTTGDLVVSSPAVADGVVYLGSWDHKVYAFGSSSNIHSVSIMDWIFPVLAIAISALCACILLVFFVRRRKGKRQLVDSAVQENPQKPKGISSTKVEVIDGIEKNFVEKTFRKKCWGAALNLKMFLREISPRASHKDLRRTLEKRIGGRFCHFSIIEAIKD